MMFATLDDLEGQVEMLVFNSAYAENADKVDIDRVVLVRGRVDHKEAGETKLIAQEVEPFEPDPEEVARAAEAAAAPPPPKRITLDVAAGRARSRSSRSSRTSCASFPGDHELAAAVGPRRLLSRARTTACPRTAPAAPSSAPSTRPRASWRRPRPRLHWRGCIARRAPTRSCTSAGSAALLRPGRATRPAASQSGCPYLYLYDDEDTRPPLHGLHAQGLPRRDRRRAVRAGRAHAPGLRRREDDGHAAAPVPRLGRARLRRQRRPLRLRQPGLLRDAGRPTDPAFDLRDSSRSSAACARARPDARSSFIRSMSTLRGALALLAGALEDRREALEARLGQERRAAARRRSRRRRAARGGRGSSRAASSSRSRAGRRAGRSRRSPRSGRPHRSACPRWRCRSPRRTGGTSRGRGRSACSRPPCGSARRAPRTSGRACRPRRRCSRAGAGTSRLAERRLRASRPRAAGASSCGSPLAEPGWSTTPTAPIASPSSQVVDQRRERLALHLPVVGGAVDQVDRVDHHRLDRAVLHQLEEGVDVVLLPAGGSPLPRRLAPDLDRLAAALDAAGVGLDEAA